MKTKRRKLGQVLAVIGASWGDFDVKKQLGWLALVGSVALMLQVAPAAVAQDSNAGAGSSAGRSSTDLPLPSDDLLESQTSALAPESVTPVPAVVREVLPTLSAAQVNTPVWRDGSLTLYATGNVSALEDEAREKMVGVDVRVLRSAHPREAIDAAIRSIVNDPTLRSAEGAFVAEAIPSEDGSRIDVGVAGPGAEAVVAKGPFTGASKGIEVRAAVVDAPIPATRNRTIPPVVSGQYMESAKWACTTGFWIGKSTGERAIISADHCGGTPGETWYYGGSINASRVIGTAQGQAAGGTDLELFMTSNTSLVSGYIFTGSATNSSSVSPIRGRYSADIIGDSVCYSGSRSGLVCQNTVISYAGSVCYEGLQCYFNVTRTTQVSGIPAAGHGDSGGPVITVLTGGHVYASGIISGISNGTATCTGDPGGTGENDRKCSSQVIYAPLEAYFNNTTGWGLMYIPQ